MSFSFAFLLVARENQNSLGLGSVALVYTLTSARVLCGTVEVSLKGGHTGFALSFEEYPFWWVLQRRQEETNCSGERETPIF